MAIDDELNARAMAPSFIAAIRQGLPADVPAVEENSQAQQGASHRAARRGHLPELRRLPADFRVRVCTGELGALPDRARETAERFPVVN